MSLRYHLIYFAIYLFLMVLSYHHYIFLVFLTLYFIYMLNRVKFKYIIFFMIFIFGFHFILPSYDQEFHSSITGKVIEVKSNSYLIACSNQKIMVYTDETLEYGDNVVMKIKQSDINQQRNDNGFDEEMYYKSHNIQIKAQCEEIISINHQYNFVDFIESRLSDIDIVRSYQRLFLLGIKDSYISDDYDQLLNLSVIHLFALSGMHLYYLKKIFKFFLSFIDERYSKWIINVFLLFYLCNIPFSLSLWRAFLMSLLSDMFKDYLNELDIYSIVFILFLTYNPYYIYNYSFMFSFGIYLFVIITSNIKYQSFYVYLLSIPLIMYSQNKVLLFSFILTIFLTPFIELFYQSIVISVLITQIGLVLELEVSLLQKVINFSSIMDYHLIFKTPSISFIVLFYSLCFMIIMRKQLKLDSSLWHCLLISLLIAFFIYGKFPLYAQITMIDVGQGDCTLIRLPFNQGSILIDTGGNRYTDLATETLIPYFRSIGLSSIDYVYISHDDFDHCGALESLIENFEVKQVIREYEKYRKIGDLEIEMLSTDCIYDNSNDNSLVMKLTLYDQTFLFTGDISTVVEHDLYEKYHHLDIDVLKVSHHGSKTATGVELFEMIQPKLALISVKKNNIYNHPHPTIIERLKKKGVTILRTDEMGMFHLRFYFKKCYIFI